MNGDILATLQRKIGRDDCEGVVREYQYAAYYVQEHWKDPFGKSVYAKLQLDEIELQSLEKRRNRLILEMESIKDRLQKIVDDADTDSQKQHTKTLSYPTDDSYRSGGGFSRGRW